MKTLRSPAVFLLGLVLGSLSPLSNESMAQPTLEDVEDALLGRGLDCRVCMILPLDLAINGRVRPDRGWRGEVEDPYGTLAGTTLFWAFRTPGEEEAIDGTARMVGIFKDGSMLWLSDSLNGIMGEFGELFAARDVNLDGKVDLLVEWQLEGNQGAYISEMVIYSWDGQTGRRISHWDSSGTWGPETAITSSGDYRLPDLNGDGILEIQAVDGDSVEDVWSWNGSEYGKWEGTPTSAPSILPKNTAQASWECSVRTDSTGGLQYEYSITNLTSSKRRIDNLIVLTNDTLLIGNRIAGWDFIPPQYWCPAMVWAKYHRSGNRWLLRPGQTEGGFWARSTAPPAISTVYVQSENEFYLPDDTFSDYIHNSTSSTTIAPVLLDTPFVSVKFVDSVLTYVSQSRTLGWITTQQAADKYYSGFSSVRTLLVAQSHFGARTALQNLLAEARLDSGVTLSSEAFALVYFDGKYLLDRVIPTGEVSLGIRTTDGLTFSVKATPAVSFSSADTARSMVATIRWPESFAITIDSVSSPVYGFSKWDSVITQGGYRYQKFRTTSPRALNWPSGAEYELFTFSIANYTGAELLELSSALPGGECHIDIGGIDRAASIFNPSAAQGVAQFNKSSTTDATWNGGGRRLVRRSGKLHESYKTGGGGEIIYRRQQISTGAWEVTTRVSGGNGTNAAPTMCTGGSSSVHIVWQRIAASGAVELWYARSTNDGTSWSTPVILPGCDSLNISYWQGGSIFPSIAERNGTQMVVVFCTSTGLRYTVSNDGGATWSAAPVGIPSSQQGWEEYVWFTSLAAYGTKLHLSYDYRPGGVWTRTFDGTTWSSEVCASGGLGTLFEHFSSIAPGLSSPMMIAWAAQREEQEDLREFRIIYREGTATNTWGWFVEFPSTPWVSDHYPSISASNRGNIGSVIDLPYMRTNGESRIFTYVDEEYTWYSCLLSSTGQFPGISLSSRTGPSSDPASIIWTEQSGPPYQLPLWSTTCLSNLLGMAHVTGQNEALALRGPSGEVFPNQDPMGSGIQLQATRRVVLERQSDHTSYALDLAPIRLVTAKGETLSVPFKKRTMGEPIPTKAAEVWDLLGSDQVDLPIDARSVILDVGISIFTRRDSLGTKVTKQDLTGGSYAVELLQSGTSSPVEQRTAVAGGSQTLSVQALAGKSARFRVSGTPPSSWKEDFTVSVGEVLKWKKPPSGR